MWNGTESWLVSLHLEVLETGGLTLHIAKSGFSSSPTAYEAQSYPKCYNDEDDNVLFCATGCAVAPFILFYHQLVIVDTIEGVEIVQMLASLCATCCGVVLISEGHLASTRALCLAVELEFEIGLLGA